MKKTSEEIELDDLTTSTDAITCEKDYAYDISYEALDYYDDTIGLPSTIDTIEFPNPKGKKADKEVLPTKLLQLGFIEKVAKMLGDVRFLKERIEELGIKHASKVHITDLKFFEKMKIAQSELPEGEKVTSSRSKRKLFAVRNNSKTRRKLTSTRKLDCSQVLPSSRALDVCPLLSARKECNRNILDSLDSFSTSVMELCGIYLNKNIFEVADSDCCQELILGEEEKIPLNQSSVSFLDGGKALLSLGTYLFRKEFFNESINFFHAALYLLLLDVGLNQPILLEKRAKIQNLSYVNVATQVYSITTPTHKYLAIILARIGDSYGKTDLLDDALEAYNASIAFWKSYIAHNETVEDGQKPSNSRVLSNEEGKDPIGALALVHNRVGGVFISKNDLSSALKAFEEALDLHIADSIEVAKTLHNIGVCHRHLDDWDKALEYYKRSHQIYENILGRNNLDTVRTLHNIGGIYRRMKKYDEAMECFQEVLRVRKDILTERHSSVSIVLISIAAVLRQSGQKKEAGKFYTAAMR